MIEEDMGVSHDRRTSFVGMILSPRTRILFFLPVLFAGGCGGIFGSPGKSQSGNPVWGVRADSAQAALREHFWDQTEGVFYSNSARGGDLNYWWQAHALDALVDGFNRTHDSSYVAKISALYWGVDRNNNGFADNYNDDMGWMALAQLRAYEATGNAAYRNVATGLWNEIKTGWDTTLGGGIYWQRKPLTYKNTPANAPACILACRLFEDFGDSSNLAWALRIHNWLRTHLVDTATGVVYDGIHPPGDVGKAQYSYNYGTYLDACLELYKITKLTSYLSEAVRTANAADSVFAPGGIMSDEGTGDGGLFNGIYIQYLVQLVLEPDLDNSDRLKFEALIYDNASSLWNKAREPGTCLFNHDWSTAPSGPVNLSVEVGGLLLLEGEALLNSPGR